MQFSRRHLLGGAAAAVATFAAGCGAQATPRGNFRVRYTDAQWRQRLTRAEYRILRGHGTERPYSSRLNDESRRGTYVCAGCNNRLFSSSTKFESGTGWPSFFRPIDGGAIGTSTDRSLGMVRTEVHCADCGGHLGHVFRDGPRPTGLRYCMNGVAMDFVPARRS